MTSSSSGGNIENRECAVAMVAVLGGRKEEGDGKGR